MSETSITFKCNEEFKNMLGKQALDLDLNASELIRACIVLALPQIKYVTGLDRIRAQDIKGDFLGNQ